jgi:serine/threonine protein kinase
VPQSVKHQNIVELVDLCRDESPYRYWLVMKFAPGGNLFERALERFKGEGFTEREVAKMISDVLFACQHMHERRIVHCDLKPENILCVSNEPDANLCVTDFGLAQFCVNAKVGKYHGTLDYMAPEIIEDDSSRSYDTKADVWSVGCLMYVLLCGCLPFRKNGPNKSLADQERSDFLTKCHIKTGEVEMNRPPWPRISDAAKTLLRRMLSKDPAQRPSAAECLKDHWFRMASGEVIHGGDRVRPQARRAQDCSLDRDCVRARVQVLESLRELNRRRAESVRASPPLSTTSARRGIGRGSGLAETGAIAAPALAV